MAAAEGSGPLAGRSVEALLSLDDAAFISTAYQWLLSRPVDPGGFRDYDARLRAGTPRLHVLAELRTSPEGQAQGVDFPGLAEALASQRPAAQPAQPGSLSELFRLQGLAFVDAAAQAVMGVPPREKERRRAAARLAAGTPRMVLVAEWLQARVHAPQREAAGLEAVHAALARGLCPVAVDANDLLAMTDEAFVDCAYKTLLGRSPDAAGLAHYTALVRAGHSPLAVVWRLRRSPEARRVRAHVPGLDAILRLYILGRVPLLGSVVRLVWSVDGESRSERHRRSLANRLDRVLQEQALLRLEAEQAREELDALLAHGQSPAVRRSPG